MVDRGAAMKRAADIFISILVIALSSPLLLVLALGVKWSSPGPVLLRKRHPGSDVVTYRFRTSTVLLRGNYRAQAQWTGSRVTPFGALLRRTSLDNLPQLLNVLEGTLSLFGRNTNGSQLRYG
jgi:putative colanic acid biosynthesis UDP-glucose lipid carrier transferase